MTTHDKIRVEKLQYDIVKYWHYHPENLINMNFLQVKKRYLLINEE